MTRKVLLTGWGSNGGVDEAVYALCDGFQYRGVSPNVLLYSVLYKEGKKALLKTDGGGEDIEFDTSQKMFEGIKWDGYDVIHTHQWFDTEDEVQELNKRRKNVPLVSTVHGYLIHVILYDPVNRDYTRRFENQFTDEERRKVIDEELRPLAKSQERIFRTADRLVFLTERLLDDFRFYYTDIDTKRAVVIPNGSDIYRYYDDKRVTARAKEIKEKIGRNSQIILYTGRFSREKGIVDLAGAFDIVAQYYPNAKLLLVGNGYESASVFNHIRPDFWKNIYFSNWINNRRELAAYYRASDVFVAPSYNESFGLSILESLMMATPVITSDIDGPRELFVKPGLSLGIEPGNIEQLASLITYLLSRPGESKQKTLKAQRTAIERYNLDNTVDKTLRLYEEVIREKRRIRV